VAERAVFGESRAVVTREDETERGLPFRLLFRVRYGECDAQNIVFNARWGDYVDIASTEYMRSLFGMAEPGEAGLHMRLVRQLIEWKAPARFDDVIEAEVRTVKVGRTSFTLATIFRRFDDRVVLALTETIYVAVDAILGAKQPIQDMHRHLLEVGAPGRLVDHAGALVTGYVS
jgi:acyl-CoA thioester hydrolase